MYHPIRPLLQRSLGALLLLLSSTATATEITALYGSQGGGPLHPIDDNSTLSLEQTSLLGLILGTPLPGGRDLELYYSRQQTRLRDGETAVSADQIFDVEIHTLELGGTVLSSPWHGWRGFVSGGLGLSHFNPSLDGGSAENRASLSLGLGAKWVPVQGIGLRLEGRFYGSLFNSTTSLFCGGGCELSVQGDLLRRYALFAGLVVRLK
jgi:hypothetical protein